MSCSKQLPPFTYEVLCSLNRDQLERFSIVCRSLKNLIDRYFHSKPYRVFDELSILGQSASYSYDLFHNDVQWLPNRDDYSLQQFFAGQESEHEGAIYSFAEMRPYLGPTVRIMSTSIDGDGDCTYSSEQIEEMESISYLWRDGEMTLSGWEDNTSLQNLLPILNSPTILQCRKVKMNFVQFSFKDYKVLYSVKFIDVWYFFQDFDQNCWPQFLEQPGIKPVVVLHYLERVHIEKMFKLFSKAFSSAVLPNAFKIVFLPFGREENESLTEFRQTNKTSGEKLELSKGISEDVSSICCDEDDLESVYLYTLERSSI